MDQNDKHHFIVIDDSKLDCFIAERIIKNTQASISIQSFVYPLEALEYIKQFDPPHPHPVIILVDIQMPLMNGFQFVDEFEKLSPSVVEKYIVYVISSSINDEDIKLAKKYPSIKKFLNKPLTSGLLLKTLREE